MQREIAFDKKMKIERLKDECIKGLGIEKYNLIYNFMKKQRELETPDNKVINLFKIKKKFKLFKA